MRRGDGNRNFPRIPCGTTLGVSITKTLVVLLIRRVLVVSLTRMLKMACLAGRLLVGGTRVPRAASLALALALLVLPLLAAAVTSPLLAIAAAFEAAVLSSLVAPRLGLRGEVLGDFL